MSEIYKREQAIDPARTDVLLIDDSITDLQLLMEMMTLRDLRISVAVDGSPILSYMVAPVCQALNSSW